VSSSYSAVGVPNNCGPDGPGFNCRQGQKNIPKWLWGPPSPLFNFLSSITFPTGSGPSAPPPPFHGYPCSFPAVTHLDSDVHSPHSITEVKNEWNYTSTLSVCLHEVTGNSFTLFFSLSTMPCTDSVCKILLHTSVTVTQHGPE
jgi:hypothetical protein